MFKKIDESLFLALNGNHHGVLDYLMIAASNLLMFIPVFIISTFIVIKYMRNNDSHYYTLMNTALILFVIVIQYFLCRYLLNETFRALFTRERPCLNPNISSFVRMLTNDCKTTLQPCFSYKVCLMFCLSTFLFFTVKEGFKGFKVLLILWSILVAYSRIYVGDHYPLSIVLSVAVGIVSGYLISGIYQYIKYDLLVI
jgi:undecaprenyl-diphosphatase